VFAVLQVSTRGNTNLPYQDIHTGAASVSRRHLRSATHSDLAER